MTLSDLKHHPWTIVKLLVVVYVVTMSVFVILFIVAGVYDMTHRAIDDVFVDRSSAWDEYFFSESGFPVINIHHRAGSREFTDHISFVGKDRPLIWFEQMGFEIDWEEEVESEVDKEDAEKSEIIAGLIPNDGKARLVVIMSHPRAEFLIFSYMPEFGFLMYQ